jgi:hypothetical protein
MLLTRVKTEMLDSLQMTTLDPEHIIATAALRDGERAS